MRQEQQRQRQEQQHQRQEQQHQRQEQLVQQQEQLVLQQQQVLQQQEQERLLLFYRRRTEIQPAERRAELNISLFLSFEKLHVITINLSVIPNKFGAPTDAKYSIDLLQEMLGFAR